MKCVDTCRTDLVSIEEPLVACLSVEHSENANYNYRDSMEDAVCIANVTLPSEGTRMSLLGIFDGHNGRCAARWCGEHMPHLVASALATALGPIDADDYVESALPAALDAAFVHADKFLVPANGIRSGTTATVAVVRAVGSTRHVCVANLGDTGAILVWKGNANAVTVGDSFDYAYSTAVIASRDPFEHFSSASNESLSCSENSVRLDANRVNTSSSKCIRRRPASVDSEPVRKTELGNYVNLSRWHRANEYKEVARVRSEGGTIFDQRVKGILNLTRSLGDFELGPSVSARPSIAQVRIAETDGTMWLILACDGLWDVCSHNQVADELLEMSSDDDEEKVSKALVNMALYSGSTDNVSVVVARI